MKNKTKRFVSLFLTIIMMVMSVSLTAFADTEADETAVSIVKNGADILSNVHEEGFLDNSGNGTAEITDTRICLRGGSDDSTHEWAKYSIDADIAGTYEVELTYSTWEGSAEWYELTNETTGETKTGVVSGSTSWEEPSTTSEWSEDNAIKTITITLNKGSNIIKVRKLYGPSDFYKMEFKLIERAPEVDESAVTIEKKGTDFLSGGQGIGYFDADGTAAEIEGEAICLRGNTDDSKNEWARYSIDADIPGTYEVELTYSTWAESDEWYEITNETTQETKKGVVSGSTSWDEPSTTSEWSEDDEIKTITLTLVKGLNIIKVRKISGPSKLYKMNFTRTGDYSFKVDCNEYISVDDVKGATTNDIAYAMPVIRPSSNHLGFVFNKVSGRYNITLCGGGNKGSVPTFILENLNTGETIKVATTDQKEYYETDYYEMGEMTFFTGDEYKVSIEVNAACLGELVFTYIEEPVYVVECKNVINEDHGNGYYDNGGENTFELVDYDKAVCLRTNDWIKNSITVPVAGTYEVIFSRGHESDERFLIENLTTDSSVNEIATATGAYDKYVDFSMGTIKLAKGENIIMTTNTSNAAYAQALKFLLVSEDKETFGVEFTASDIESTSSWTNVNKVDRKKRKKSNNHKNNASF